MQNVVVVVVVVVGGGGGGELVCMVEMKESMQRICLCFTPSRIAIVESAHLFCGSVLFQLGLFFLEQETVRYSRFKIWLIFMKRGWQHTALK